MGTASDIEQLQAQIESLQAELRGTAPRGNPMQRVIDHLPFRVFWKSLDNVYLGCNAIFAQDSGLGDPALVVGKNDYQLAWTREEAELYRNDDRQVMDTGLAKIGYEEPQTRTDGTLTWLRTSKVPLREHDGRVFGVLGIYEDITRRKQAEQLSSHRERLEAIGRLAGGVAHDFNNMLTAILGNLDDLDDDALTLGEQAEARRSIRDAAERAADLTGQLLAFARRQIIKPIVLDPNERLREIERMMKRVLGEQVGLKTSLDPCCWSIRMDPGQFEQLVINLAVNARDAMPEGGTLSFETTNVLLGDEQVLSHPDAEPGEYVRLIVSDDGQGIDPSVQPHIFEPFFTTKGPTHGTGLGLATCHGIVKQNSGHIWLRSEPGQGTTFEIYLPRADEHNETDEPASTSIGGNEIVLVLEDEPLVRRICTRGLRRQGYEVLEADTCAEAIELLETHRGAIDAFVSDVVLPDGYGPSVASKLLARYPNAKVLYVSGYTETTIVHGGSLKDGVNFLQKPYTARRLGQMLRQLLDGA